MYQYTPTPSSLFLCLRNLYASCSLHHLTPPLVLLPSSLNSTYLSTAIRPSAPSHIHNIIIIHAHLTASTRLAGLGFHLMPLNPYQQPPQPQMPPAAPRQEPAALHPFEGDYQAQRQAQMRRLQYEQAAMQQRLRQLQLEQAHRQQLLQNDQHLARNDVQRRVAEARAAALAAQRRHWH
jgi:hypothetical protein